MSSNKTPEPVVVFYKTKHCKHCDELDKIWDNGDGSIFHHMSKVYPKLRQVKVNSERGRFNTQIIPSDLIRYGEWFPTILLIPGKIWDNAMKNLGPNNKHKLIDGVQIYNGTLIQENNDYKPIHYHKFNQRFKTNHKIYKGKDPKTYAEWVKNALDNIDFRNAQGWTTSSSSANNNNINNINNTNTTNNSNINNIIEEIELSEVNNSNSNSNSNTNNNICSTFKIITRKSNF